MIMGKLLLIFIVTIGLIILTVVPTEGKRLKKVGPPGVLPLKIPGKCFKGEMNLYDINRCHKWAECKWDEKEHDYWYNWYYCGEGEYVDQRETVCKKLQSNGCPPKDRLYAACDCPGRKKPQGRKSKTPNLRP